MATPTQDRLIRKEVALATIRAIEPPQGHIGLSIVPFREVGSDDVIFDYAKPTVTGLAPARAEDAESELAQKDAIFGGVGRAAILDWAQKDHYTASDVSSLSGAGDHRGPSRRRQRSPPSADGRVGTRRHAPEVRQR